MRLTLFIVYAVFTFMIGVWFEQLLYTPALYALFTVPGTTIHELSHYLTAEFMNGSPSGFSIIPTGNTLGHVMMVPNWYNAAPVGLAPFDLVPFTALFILFAVRTKKVLWIPINLYLAACCWAACIPSDADLQIAISSPVSFVFALLIFASITYAVYLFGRASLRAQVKQH